MELTTQEYDELRGHKERADTLFTLLYYTITRYGIMLSNDDVISRVQVVPLTIDPSHIIDAVPLDNGTMIVAIKSSSTLTAGGTTDADDKAKDPIKYQDVEKNTENVENVGETEEGEGVGLVSLPSSTAIDVKEDEDMERALKEVME